MLMINLLIRLKLQLKAESVIDMFIDKGSYFLVKTSLQHQSDGMTIQWIHIHLIILKQMEL